jgi:hypothetical protein
MTKLRLDRLYGGSGGLAAFSIMKTQTALTEKSQTSTSRQPASVDDLHRGSESSFGKAAWAVCPPTRQHARSGDRDRAAIASRGALYRCRGETVDELVFLVGDELVEYQVLVVEYAVLRLQ